MKVVQTNPNHVTYIIEVPETGRLYRVHHRQLKKWYIPPKYLQENLLFQELLMDHDTPSELTNTNHQVEPIQEVYL